MTDYTQADRPLALTTPLGDDVLLLTGFRGHESISELFSFELDLITQADRKIAFDEILGQSVTVEMRLLNDEKRYFNGIVRRFSQGGRDEEFLHFHAEVVPKLWLLTKKLRSRIFQHLSVPDILREVLTGLDVTYEIRGSYSPRDYCVQYRESDFQFVSRLMEEEGIYYFFKHTDESHSMVVTDISNQHPAVAGQSDVIYEELLGGKREEMRVWSWEKTQELRAGEYTLWDHCFELPTNHLEAKEKTIETVSVGKVAHKLNVGGNDQLEIYDYPGGYAQRFDGIDRNGEPQPDGLKGVYRDSERTVMIRMEQEEVNALEIHGAGNCGQFAAGHKFTLQEHFDAEGAYLLIGVSHEARLNGNYRSGESLESHYENTFTCIPTGLSYRPQRVTPKPLIAGVQTATVVGPAGEEIFCDKYGRVKVQFHWDREGKKNAASSCWLRVAQVWAGKGWGAFFWPRVGHEVVVTFEEGDPDQPMIIGSVYNAENMPWFGLPINKQLAGFKSASERGKAGKNYNGIVFNDEKGREHLSIHSENNLSFNSEADKMTHTGRHKGERVSIANMLTVGKFTPIGGGSGGGFDEGNPMPDPPPTGIVGLNAVFTYGDALQATCPANQQLVIGNNLQMCINPIGLMAGAPGSSAPAFMQVLAGSGMGGSMQFTVGTSAQFTLGQSFEISIGPPKIEIHAPYGDHAGIAILCGLLSAFSIIFMILYDVKKGPNDSQLADKAAATAGEQSGDEERVKIVLAYQILTDAMLVAIMALEAIADSADWLADNTMKALYDIDQACLDRLGVPSVGPDAADKSWGDNWQIAVGFEGVAAAVLAEVFLAAGK